MRIDEQAFSAQVELPCKVFCGPDAKVEFSGTAVNIDPGSLMLDLGMLHGPWRPSVGDQVRLELHLPVHQETANAKSMIVRARVTGVTGRPDGTTRMELKFRKPSFKDRIERLTPQAQVATGWRM